MNILNLTDDLIPQAQQIVEHLCGNADNFIKAEFYGVSALFVQRSKPMGTDRYVVNTDHGLMVIMDQEGINFQPKPLIEKYYYCKLNAGRMTLPAGDKKYLIKFHSLDPMVVSYQMIENGRPRVLILPDKTILENISLSDVTIESFEPADVDDFIR